jgi:hypothetical protein
MRITFQTDGGLGFFPGLARPVTFDLGDLDAKLRDELCKLVDKARFFERTQPEAPAAGGADRRTYTVTIERDGKERTLRLSDPIGDAGLGELVQHLRDAARARLGR